MRVAQLLGASRRKPKLAELFPRRRFEAGADSPPRTPPVAMPKKLIGRDATATLGVSLNTDATSLNNTVKLLSILRPGSDPSAARSAVIALERFFSERLCRGDLRGDAVESDAATAKYAEWFQKHYKLFTKRLCGLLAGTAPGAPRSRDGPSAADAKLQVLALAAVMECARSEHPGRFNNELYASALTAALRGDAFTPELLGALASRYLTKVDVRYHTYAVVARVADQPDAEEATKPAPKPPHPPPTTTTATKTHRQEVESVPRTCPGTCTTS